MGTTERVCRKVLAGSLGSTLRHSAQGMEVGEEEELLQACCSRTKNTAGEMGMEVLENPGATLERETTQEWWWSGWRAFCMQAATGLSIIP